MLGNVSWFCALFLAGCTVVQGPRLVVRGSLTLEEPGHRRGFVHAALRWVAVPRPVQRPLEPLPTALPNDVPGRLGCIDRQLCAWEHRARIEVPR